MDWSFAFGCSTSHVSATQFFSSYGQPVHCPTGTSIPLLLRTRRRTRVAVPRNRGCEAVPPPASSAPPPIAWLRCPLCATANGEFVRVQIIRLRGKYPKKQLF